MLFKLVPGGFSDLKLEQIELKWIFSFFFGGRVGGFRNMQEKLEKLCLPAIPT